MDDKIDIFWLSSDNVSNLIKSIETGDISYRVLNSKTQKYMVFKHKNVNIVWPSLNNKIYHNIDQNEHFRESKVLQNTLFKSHSNMLNETVIFPCVLDLQTQNLSPNQSLFDWYNPYILNYPMRIALMGDDIQSMVDTFIEDKVDYEYIIKDNIAHVEYVPEWFGKLVDIIPNHYWTLRNYNINQSLEGWRS